MPTLRDPNFADTVLLMLEHNAEGAVGLVMNRPFPGDPQDVCQGLGIDWAEGSQGNIRRGGPVRTQAGCIVHPPSAQFQDTQIITPDIAVSTSREALEHLVTRTDIPFHLMLGYAGWGPGQLEREMTDGTWLLAPVHSPIIFEPDTTDIYDRALASLGVARHELACASGLVH
jgi:putative transcriptional regulator